MSDTTYAPWMDDADPPDDLTDTELEKMLSGVAQLMKGNEQKNWDESEHPRDPDGKFTDAGGGLDAGDNESSGNVVAGEPRIVSAIDQEQKSSMQRGIGAIPKEHLRAIGDLDVEGHADVGNITHELGVSGFYGHRDPGNRQVIVISKRLDYATADGKRASADVKQPETVMVHELGHALDFMKDNKLSEDIGRSVIDEAFFGKLSNSFGPGKNITDAMPGSTYYLGSPHEAFAELYALQYSPNESATFFGMDKPLAELMFQKSLAKLRAMDLSKYPTTELIQ